MRLLLALAAVPVIAMAQTSFPDKWPSGAESLSPEALQMRLVGKTSVAKSVTDPDVRTEYRETYAYINVGNTSDSGRWRTEGSAVCNEWRNLRQACSEIRALGPALYVVLLSPYNTASAAAGLRSTPKNHTDGRLSSL